MILAFIASPWGDPSRGIDPGSTGPLNVRVTNVPWPPVPQLAGTVGEVALGGHADAPRGRGCADPARGEVAVRGCYPNCNPPATHG